MNGVVGLHVGFGGSRDQSIQVAREFGGGYAVVLNDPALCKQLEDAGVVGIYRIKTAEFDDDNAHQHFDPESYLRRADADLHAAGVVKRYVHYSNEPGNQDLALLRRRLRRAIEVAHELGLILVVLNIAYRNWTIRDWDYLSDELALIKQYGYFVGVHEGYSWELTTLATAFPESIGRFIESQNKYGFKVIVTEFAASLSPHDGWSEWLTETEWLSLLRQAVEEVYAPRGVPVCLYTLYPWQRGFDYHGDNAKYFRAGVGQLNAAFPIVTPPPTVEPEPEPVSDYVDMLRVICPPNSRRYRLFGMGDEHMQVVQAPDGWCEQRKNALVEEFQVTKSAIRRGADTSSLWTPDGKYRGEFYIQWTRKPDGTLEYGCDWSGRFMKVGDAFLRNTHITWHDYTGKQLRAYDEQSTLALKKHHPSYTFTKSGIVVKDVYELQWGGEEVYLYARDYGLVGWLNARTGASSFIGSYDNVIIQQPHPHPIPRPVVPFPPIGEPPVSAYPPVTDFGDPAPATVSKVVNNYANIRPSPTTAQAPIGTVKAGSQILIRPKSYPDGGVYSVGGITMSTWYALNVGWLAAGVVTIEQGAPDKPVKTLDVPYYSQTSTDANLRANDCGLACARMIIGYEFKRVGLRDPKLITVNKLVMDTSLVTADKPLPLSEIEKVLDGYGVEVDYKRPLTPDAIISEIDAGRPPLVLVNYKHINSAQKSDMGHYVVVVSYGERGFWLHDPYLLGASVYITRDALNDALTDLGEYASFDHQGLVLAA